MFQSVIEQQEWRARRLGTGAGVSVMVHAGILAAVMLVSSGVAQQEEKEPPEVKLYVAKPRGTPIPPSTPAVAQTPKPQTPKPKNKLVQPQQIPTTTPPETAQPPDTMPPPDDLPYNPDGDPDSEVDVPPCPTCIAVKDLVPTNLEPTGEEVLPYVQGTMTAPKLLSGASIEYTREAREAHVSGLLIARCTITRDGEVESCRIIKGQPHMNEAVLAALKTRRYTPVMFQGKPVSVTYNFNVNLNMAH